jgi:hypothetical protein
MMYKVRKFQYTALLKLFLSGVQVFIVTIVLRRKSTTSLIVLWVYKKDMVMY